MKDGFVQKAAENSVSAEDLSSINRFTRREMKAEEVYVFSVILCDNEIDRDFERFSTKALQRLAKLFVGKTGIFDHSMRTGDQTARIFACEVEFVPGKKNSVGEPYARLRAKAYLPRCEKNEALILELDSGIKKEVSVGCAVERVICSVCGADLRKSPCSHRKGQILEGTNVPIYALLEDPSDAYEWSFVAVPAQPAAGVVKNFDRGNVVEVNRLEEKNVVTKILDRIQTSAEDVILTKTEVLALRGELERLREVAKEGEIYRADLRKEVLGLCAAHQPELSGEMMCALTKRMSIEELKCFRDAYRTKNMDKCCKGVQLNPGKSENTGDGIYPQFRI